jgi:poly(3-hydroxybutyrate) depolymerase
MFYTKDLLNHISDNYCINKRRVYATGLGQGGGMVHQLACHTHLSRRFGAFAAVGGAFYQSHDSKDRLWGSCMIGRRPIPILEIHGEKDEKYPLEQREKGLGKKLLPASRWVKTWSKNNKCGDILGEPTASQATDAVILTQLEGGQVSESLAYAGGAIRTAYRCGKYPDRKNDDFSSEEKSLKRISVLHYAVKGFKHGWPRIQFKHPEKEVEFHGKRVKPPGSPNFDASAIILNYFRHHRLPDSATIMGQAKKLLIERGAKAYKQDGMPRIPQQDHSEL